MLYTADIITFVKLTLHLLYILIMALSKKESSILIEIIYYVLFTVLFLPKLCSDRSELQDIAMSTSILIAIVVFSVIYFSFSYILLEILNKKKMSSDERDLLIELKSYRLGYNLHILFIPSLIGVMISQICDIGNLIIFSVVCLLLISTMKSIYQFYLYRTS